jgi:hypothetical protein
MDFATALWASVWGENSLPARIVITVICLATLRAALWAWRHLLRFEREQNALRQVLQRLAAWRSSLEPPVQGESKSPERDPAGKDQAPAGTARSEPPLADPAATPAAKAVAAAPTQAAPTPAAEPAARDAMTAAAFTAGPPVADLETLSAGIPQGTLIAERLAAIDKLRAHQVRVDLVTLQQLSRAREAARPGLSAASDGASLVMMLGLLGTFLGLAIMVQRIHYALPGETGAMSVESWSGAIRNVAGVLAGVKTAFSASLVGIVCAIFCTSLNRRLRSAQLRVFERLERITTEDLLPAMVPAAGDESLLDRVSRQLESSFAHLDAIFQLNQEALQEMTGAEDAFLGIVDEIRRITNDESSRNFATVVEQLGAATGAMAKIVEQLAGTNRAVLKVAEQVPAVATAIQQSQGLVLARLAAAPRQERGTTGLAWWVAAAIAVGAAILWMMHS